MSFVWGWLCDRIGPKRTLIIVLASWAVGLVLGGVAIGLGPAGLAPFLVAGAILGSGLGGVTVADRVLMVRLSPPERIGEFFGLYGLVGKGSQVIGTLLYGLILFLLLDRIGNGAYQVAVLSLLVTMLIGVWLVWPVRDDWSGSDELAADAVVVPPERLAPASAPIEPAGDLVGVAVRVRPAPRPRRSDHLVETGSSWSPAEDVCRAVRRGDQDRRVAGSAWPDLMRDRPPDDGLGRRDDLEVAEPAAVAEVAREEAIADPRVAGRRRLDRPEVGVGEVGHVDVVADARPVAGRVVVAEDRQRSARPLPPRGRPG